MVTRLLAVVFLAALVGCSTNAELKRPEDVTALRASYTKASAVYSIFMGSTEVCQITALTSSDREISNEEAASLIADYSVVLDEEGCAILPKASLE